MNAPVRKRVTFAIPVLNEAANIQRLYDRLTAVADDLGDRYEFEFFFTDNCSSDDTWQLLSALAASDPRVRGLRFSRNYGFQASILANYMACTGDAIIQLDADLQDPPELARSFIEHWEQGYQVVYGIRRSRKETALMNTARRIGYGVINRLSDHEIPKHVGDFRLIDRSVVKLLEHFNDYSPYLRGAIASLGLRQIGIQYDRERREFGESKFSIGALVDLGLDGLFNYSKVPIRVAAICGAAAVVFSVVWTVVVILTRLFQPDLPSGLASTQILVLFSLGLNSLFLGIIGEYVLRIYMNVRKGPLVVIEEQMNMETDEVITAVMSGLAEGARR